MRVILMSLFAGVVGMGLGGLLTAIFGKRTDKMISIFLSFAGGVMLSVVFLELIPEAVGHSSVEVTIIGLIAGVVMVLLLHNLIDRISFAGKAMSKLHESYTEYFHADDMLARRTSLLRSGMIMLFAIGLHNIPEGLALGAAGHHDAGLGFSLAIIIGLHNIPEGMAVSAPLVAGGLSRLKAITLTLLIGATTLLGAVTGLLIGGISDTAVALSFSIAGGAMLYVVLSEILPQSIVSSKDRIPTVFALVGILVGMLFTVIFG